jgi:peptidyl-prolyl cis-trans isomerase D
VRVEFVELSLDALAARATVSPEDVKKVYDEEVKAGKHGTREERRASHILVTAPADAKDDVKKAAEAKAKDIADQVRKNPKSFAEIAKKESQDPGSAGQGGDLGFFARGAMVKPFEEAAFAAKKGEIVGPVKSDFGYHVILVTDIKPEKVRSLAEATPEIEANLKKAKAQAGFPDSVEQLNNIVYEQSSSLQPAAEKLGLPIQQSPWITQGNATTQLSNPSCRRRSFPTRRSRASATPARSRSPRTRSSRRTCWSTSRGAAPARRREGRDRPQAPARRGHAARDAKMARRS